jgi:hypothetical protein
MKLMLWSCALICLGCAPREVASGKKQAASEDRGKEMKAKKFTESDGCQALLRDLKIKHESPLGKALLAEQFSREPYSGNCIIETGEEQLAFNVEERTFRIVRGTDPKTGAPHRIFGRFFLSDSGELKARFD